MQRLNRFGYGSVNFCARLAEVTAAAETATKDS